MLNDWNILIWEYRFLSPYLLLLLALVPLFVWWRFRLEARQSGQFKFSGTTTEQQNLGQNYVKYFRWIVILAYGAISALLILAVARPSHWSGYDDYQNNYKNGIDIILAMDISYSMQARDFEPTRLEAAKRVAIDFVNGRKGDRIGLVVYEGEAFTACPATIDYTILKKQIDALQSGLLQDGTAIGTGLGTAVTRLRNDSLPSKVIILLTDGINNEGEISPIEAAQLAKAKKVRVYTIGVGSQGTAPTPIMTPFGVQYENLPVEIDEVTLAKIADITGGKYFRATNEDKLRNIYKEIENLEKRKIKDIDYKSEPPVRPLPFLNWALALMLSVFVIQTFYFKTNG